MIYEFTLGANASQTLPGGYHISVLEASEEITIERFGANGNRLEVAENVPASWYWRQPVWTQDPNTKQVKVTAGSLGATVKISISDGESGVNVLSGTVRVSNQTSSLEQTEAGGQMLGGLRETGVSAQYSYIQLLNPVSSGVVVYVQRMICDTATNGIGIINRYGTALTTAATMGTQHSKRGNQTPAAQLRQGTDASGTLGTTIGSLRLLADTPYAWLIGTPLKLDQGEGILSRSPSTNGDLQVFFEWEEVAA